MIYVCLKESRNLFWLLLTKSTFSWTSWTRSPTRSTISTHLCSLWCTL